MRRYLGRLMLMIGLLLAIAACGSTGGSTTTTAAPPAGPETSVAETTAGAAETRAATVPAQTAAATSAAQTATTAAQAAGATAEEATGIAGTATAGNDYGRTLTVMTHDSFDASAEVIAEFERENRVNLRFLESGDAGATLNRAILSKGNPLADVLYGVDNTFFSRAIESDIFEPYRPATLAQIPEEMQLDPEGRLIPVDFGFVNFNYDKAALGPGKLPVPETLRDLTKPEYKGKIVVPSPATSSPGLAFLLTTVAAFGESGDYPWTQFWTDLRDNDVQIVEGWETAYYTNFSGSSGKGAQPIVLSYATSPAAEVYFAGGAITEPPTANFAPPKGAFRQIEFVGILKGTQNLELAQKWVDFMTGPRFQADIPLKMFVYPVNTEAPLPELFQKFAAVPADPAVLPPDEIAAKREQWLREWTRLVQR